MSEPDETQASNLELTRRAFEVFDPADPAPTLAFAAEDIEVYMPADLPNGGSFSGHDGYREWLDGWLEAWDDFAIEIKTMEPVGRRHVVTSAIQSATGRGSGIPVRMDMAYLTEVRGDEFIALHLYMTPGEAAEVARRREG